MSYLQRDRQKGQHMSHKSNSRMRRRGLAIFKHRLFQFRGSAEATSSKIAIDLLTSGVKYGLNHLRCRLEDLDIWLLVANVV